MFGSTVGAGTVPGNSGVPGPNWIPRRFVWPHGGRRVFLIGSFTRWSAVIPMSPVQGYPSVFQVVCSLPPGYHQYKFNVDGEWKHDEQQPSVGGDYGIVNAICLVREQDNFFPILSAETPSRSHMEIDNAGFGHAEANPRLSDADLQAFRSRISILLSTHTAYDLLPESGKVIALDTTLSVEEAIHVLHEEGIPLAPLWDLSKCQFVGMLCAMDFILMLNELGKHGSNLTEEQLQTNTVAAWKEAKVQLSRTDGNARTDPWRLIHAGPLECLKDVALKILQNKVATVPIIHIPSEDGSFPQLLYLASLSSILQCICKHFQSSSASLPILQLPIGSIPIGTWVPKAGESNEQPLVMLRPNASLGDALSLLIQAEVSSIPIVDNNDSLLDIYSRSDVAALIKNKAYARINLKEFSVHQALLLLRNGDSPYGHPQSPRCHMCLRSDPLHKVMEQLANPGVRRLVIVEAGSRRVEGIISLSDLFRFLLG